jgi:hypothetical protein
VITGNPGTRLITIPERTSMIGKGNLYFVLSTPKNVMPNRRMMIRLIFSMI